MFLFKGDKWGQTLRFPHESSRHGAIDRKENKKENKKTRGHILYHDVFSNDFLKRLNDAAYRRIV